ncbi:MAG: VCBS repeat-containing protein, partial [Phaeodactylibacter sp.]|nr:VCBS repeat-containing protein [Phaeodactylibacter sp.]
MGKMMYLRAAFTAAKVYGTIDRLSLLTGLSSSGKRIFLNGLTALLLFMAGTAPAQTGSRESDSLALVALYNATDGPNWTNTWDLTQPMDMWYGVTLNGEGRVESLNLYNNQLNGVLTSNISGLTELKILNLSFNSISGPIPIEIAELSALENLNLSRTQISGSIPAQIGSLYNLSYLALFDTRLSGPIPPELGSLSNLITLSLSNSSFLGGDLNGSIPAELGNMTNLVNLFLYNNDLSGPIPAELGNLTNLESLRLHNNQLSGSIPEELANLSQLKSLWLAANQLTGSIPPSLGNLSQLVQLALYSNQLAGQIPIELGNLSQLVLFNLSDNQLSGPIPSELGTLSQLDILRLENNQLNGDIPVGLANLGGLWELFLSDNLLSGNIPAELGNLSNLRFLALNDNQLNGPVPASLAGLPYLTRLYCHNNQLSGCFPGELSVFCSLGFNNANTYSQGYNFTGNPGLPGGGDFQAFCDTGAGSCSTAEPTLVSLSGNQVQVQYGAPVDGASLNTASLRIWGGNTGLRTGAYSANSNLVTFTADEPFQAGELLHILARNTVQYSNGDPAPAYNWIRQAPATNPTPPYFTNIVNTGIVLPAAAYAYSYQFLALDLNRDGRQDLMHRYHASSGGSTNVLVYLRNPDGSFAAPDSYSNSASYSGLNSAPDLNNDGYPDLLLSYNFPSQIQVRLSDGTGAFGNAVNYPVTPYCNGVTYCDVDLDGDLDLLAFAGNATLSANTISILINNGDGTFQPQQTISTGVFSSSLVPADADNDGDMDLLYSSNTAFGSDPSFRIYLNDGAGGFSLNTNEANPVTRYVLGAFDYNEDGIVDILSGNGPGLELHQNNSTLPWTLYNPTLLDNYRGRTYTGDLDGDGDLDVISPNRYDGASWGNLPMQYFLNDGNGGFSSGDPNQFVPGSYSYLSDYDGDGDLDIFYIENGTIYVALNGPLALPSCSNLSSPADGAVDVPVDAGLSWAASPGATGYRLSIGAGPGGTDILDNADVGDVTAYDPGPLPYNTIIFVTITPYNTNGDAVGCTEESFQTGGCPDLVIENLSYSTGQLYAEVRNIGTALADLSGINVNFSYSPDGNPSSSFATQLQFGNFGPYLNPGEAQVLDFYVNVNYLNHPSLVGQVDVFGEMAECNEDNNIMVLPLILGCADPSAHNYNPAANSDDGSCETCSDGIQNGDETGVDCGGALCQPCPCHLAEWTMGPVGPPTYLPTYQATDVNASIISIGPGAGRL